MADITYIFRDSVNSCRKSAFNDLHLNENVKQNVFPIRKHKSDFENKSRELTSELTRLRDFLLAHRQDYINPTSHLSYMTSRMNDSQRDAIDDESQKIIKKCQEAITLLREQGRLQRAHSQVQEHRDVVYSLLDNYLKGVCRLYSEQRAIRVKRIVDVKQMHRIEPDQRRNASLASTKGPDPNDKASGDAPPADSRKYLGVPSDTVLPQDDDISSEEAQLFEQENQVLFNEMNTMMSEVRQIEGKVVEISRLQEIFSEKILEQETSIDAISETTATSTDNIKDGNEEIREAMKNNAGFRVWILFVIIICSVSLLFLDWYND